MRIAIALLLPCTALAAPLTITHQGRLLDGTGLPIQGPHTVDVALYDVVDSETAFWSDSYPVVVDNGYFSVELGSDTPALVAADFASRDDVWVGVGVDSGTEMTPRRKLGSVPYALGSSGAGEVPLATVVPTSSTSLGQLTMRSVPGPGGNDADTVLLIQSDTAGGTSQFFDRSPSAQAITTNGTVTHSEQTSRIGASALDFRGGGHLSIPDSAAWDFLGDFTIDFWVYLDSRPYSWIIVHRNYTNLSGSLSMYLDSPTDSSNLNVGAFDASSNGVINFSSASDIPLQTWTHVALVREGSVATLYFNGLVEAVDSSAAGAISGDPSPLRLGDLQSYSGDSFDGLLDEVRISNGIARWSGPFVPPTQPYGTGDLRTRLFLMDHEGVEHEVQMVTP